MTVNVFEREIKLCQDFQPNEEERNRNIYLTFNVSNGEIPVWIHFDENLDKEYYLKILNELVS